MAPKTEDQIQEELKQLKLTLPKEQWFNGYPMYHYQGFWCLNNLESILAFQNNFQAQDTDIFATSFRKTGTTWLKSLLFSICNRTNHSLSESPLLTHNPHELVPQLESNIYRNSSNPDLISNFKSPRLFGTHLPFSSLHSSITNTASNCKIIYICRNPLDTFISSWMFYSKLCNNRVDSDNDMMGQYFDKFCEGKFPFGPFEDHVLGYWKQSLERPKKVFFVNYEGLKTEPKHQLKQLAEFVGFPFSEEEETQGVVDRIVELCSIQSLKEMEVNKSNNRLVPQIQNKWFFRKGEVGDWVNYLTPSMADQLEKMMEEKFRGSGLTFK